MPEDVWVIDARKRVENVRCQTLVGLISVSGNRKLKEELWNSVSSLLFEMALLVPSQRKCPTANFRCWGNIEPAGHQGRPQESAIWITLWHSSAAQTDSSPSVEAAAVFYAALLCCDGGSSGYKVNKCFKLHQNPLLAPLTLLTSVFVTKIFLLFSCNYPDVIISHHLIQNVDTCMLMWVAFNYYIIRAQ